MYIPVETQSLFITQICVIASMSVEKVRVTGWRYDCGECPVASLYSRTPICGLLSCETLCIV